MANGAKSSSPPGGEKFVHLRPTIEAHAETVRLEHPEDLGESRREPPGAVVVRDRAVAAIAVMRDVRRIGEHEVDAPSGKLWQDRQAIAVHDLIDEVGRRWRDR